MSESLEQTNANLERMTHKIIEYLSSLMEAPPSSFSSDSAFDEIGLASAETLMFITDLEDLVGVELNSTLVCQFRTIGELAAHLTTLVPQLPLSDPT